MPFESVIVQDPVGARYGPATIPEVQDWIREGRVPRDAYIFDAATNEARPLSHFPELARCFGLTAGDIFMPKNTPAVVGYYIGIFAFAGQLAAFIPGFIMGVVAIILGLVGLRRAKENPLLHGRGHAITAIVCGIINVLIPLALLALLLIASA